MKISQQNNELANKLAQQVENILYPEIQAKWLRGVEYPKKLNVEPSERKGATDAITFEANIEVALFLKFHLTSEQEEKKGYNILRKVNDFKKHLIPPLFPNLEKTLWIQPFANAVTLHELIASSSATDKFVKDLYLNFLNMSKKLWFSTKSKVSPNLNEIYVSRIFKRINQLKKGLNVREFNNVKINVNGIYQGTFQDLIDNFQQRVTQLNVNYSCTIHGDEHAKNIIVYNDAVGLNPFKWAVIDYVNARKKGDWIFSIAKMMQWWQFYYVVELAKENAKLKNEIGSKLRLRNNVLYLEYDEDKLESHIPRICTILKKSIKEIAEETGLKFRENPQNWKKRLKLALFSVIFGSMPLHFEKTKFAVPIMIGKSIEYLKGRSPFR